MTATCFNCGGHGFTKTPDIYDCSAPTCTAAERRTSLDAAIKRHEQQLGEAMGREERDWFCANWKAIA